MGRRRFGFRRKICFAEANINFASISSQIHNEIGLSSIKAATIMGITSNAAVEATKRCRRIVRKKRRSSQSKCSYCFIESKIKCQMGVVGEAVPK
jgi:hypothetical protein